MLAFGVAAALWHRRRTGGAARIDFSMLEAMLWTMAEPLLAAQLGAPPQPRGNASDRSRPARRLPLRRRRRLAQPRGHQRGRMAQPVRARPGPGAAGRAGARRAPGAPRRDRRRPRRLGPPATRRLRRRRSDPRRHPRRRARQLPRPRRQRPPDASAASGTRTAPAFSPASRGAPALAAPPPPPPPSAPTPTPSCATCSTSPPRRSPRCARRGRWGRIRLRPRGSAGLPMRGARLRGRLR